jgi:hypothetical protein
MAKIVLDVSTSLDGFISEPGDSIDCLSADHAVLGLIRSLQASSVMHPYYRVHR